MTYIETLKCHVVNGEEVDLVLFESISIEESSNQDKCFDITKEDAEDGKVYLHSVSSLKPHISRYYIKAIVDDKTILFSLDGFKMDDFLDELILSRKKIKKLAKESVKND